MNLISDDEAKTIQQNSIGDKVTVEQMMEQIDDVDYLHIGGTVTICNILLKNGYSVRGESACVDSVNFNAELGKKLAHDDAFRKLWPLFGFLLAETRWQEEQRRQRTENAAENKAAA